MRPVTKVTLTTTPTGSQVVKINRTSLEFTAAIMAQIGKIKAKIGQTSSQPDVMVGKCRVLKLAAGQYALTLVKNGMSHIAATIVVKKGKIVAAK